MIVEVEAVIDGPVETHAVSALGVERLFKFLNVSKLPDLVSVYPVVVDVAQLESDELLTPEADRCLISDVWPVRKQEDDQRQRHAERMGDHRAPDDSSLRPLPRREPPENALHPAGNRAEDGKDDYGSEEGSYRSSACRKGAKSPLAQQNAVPALNTRKRQALEPSVFEVPADDPRLQHNSGDDVDGPNAEVKNLQRQAHRPVGQARRRQRREPENEPELAKAQ